MVQLNNWFELPQKHKLKTSVTGKSILKILPKKLDVRPGCHPRYFEHEDNENSIVLIHGLTDSPYFMTAIGERFAASGFNVYIPLLPGHGLINPNGMRNVTLEQWKETVASVVEYASSNKGKLSIGGLSTGGTLSVWQAKEKPDLIDGAVFLFSAALDIADDEMGFSIVKKGDFKERLLRSYSIRKLLARIEDITSPLLIGDNPYRYSRMDYDGAGNLAHCIKEVEGIALKQPLFVAHSEADEAADVLGVEKLIEDHLEPTAISYYRMGKALSIPHASVVLENDVLAEDGSPLEPKNPFFNEMMNRVSLFVKQKLLDSQLDNSTLAMPLEHQESPQVLKLKEVFFDYRQGTYNSGIAYWLAYMSELVYARIKDVSDLKEPKPHHTEKFPHKKLILSKLQALDPDFIAVKGFENNSSQAIIIHHKNYLVASFRGTDEIADWIDNINMGKTASLSKIKEKLKKSFKSWMGIRDTFSTNQLFGRVHQGFYQAFLDVWDKDEMWIELEKLIKETKLPLWITGHSLGGAMATFAAAWMTERNLPIRGVYTFGQPRCGDKNFSTTLNAKLPNKFFRFHNNNDIVPRLPARLMNFEHTGRLVFITKDGKLDADPARWDRFLESVRGIVDDILDSDKIPYGIEDHNVINGYILGISSWNNRNPHNW